MHRAEDQRAPSFDVSLSAFSGRADIGLRPTINLMTAALRDARNLVQES
jgi:hypothetical protein